MPRLAVAVGLLAMVVIATILYATARDERVEEVAPPASLNYSIVNDGPSPAARLHVEGQNFGNVEVVENAPGCPTAARTAFGLFEAAFEWSSACIDPGEEIVVRTWGDCPECTGPLTVWRWEEVEE